MFEIVIALLIIVVACIGFISEYHAGSKGSKKIDLEKEREAAKIVAGSIGETVGSIIYENSKPVDEYEPRQAEINYELLRLENELQDISFWSRLTRLFGLGR